MSSTTTIPPTHVPCASDWPALSPSRLSSHHEVDDWELLPDSQDGLAEVVETTSFERDFEPVRVETEPSAAETATAMAPVCLKHAMSTPNFHTVLEVSDDDDAAPVHDNNNNNQAETASVESWGMVSGPPSVASSWSNASKMSFRDVVMKESIEEASASGGDHNETDGQAQAQAQPSPKSVKKKPKFVVKPIKRCAKSMADLRSLARIVENGGDENSYHPDAVLGETDAELYYSQKQQGKIGRKNGQKTRPDEAKRLQITMAKKEDQRQRQKAAAAMKKR